ncbi:MAG TPA: hypothetical protein VFO08_03585 [Methylomirabilota bacterium]|jgi:hypothetical protein|nr:hypothetical protein [Methylomirabilota bacterium]
MNCEDASDGLSTLVGGHLGLTDWTLLEAHLAQCAECRRAEADLRQRSAVSRPVTERRVLALLRRAMELARIGVTWSTAVGVCGRTLVPAAARVPASRVTAGVMRAVGLAVGRLADLMVSMRASLASVHELAGGIIARASQGFGRDINRLVAEVARLWAWLAVRLWSSGAAMVSALEGVRRTVTRSVKRTIGFRASGQAVGVVLALACTLYAMQRADGPQQLARPSAPPAPELQPTGPVPAPIESARLEPTRPEPAPAETTQPAPSLPAPSLAERIVSGVPPRTNERRTAPVRAVPSSPSMLRSEPPTSAPHVVGRLSAKDPGAVEREFIVLLADVGGAELGRSHRVRFTAIEVIVPQSRYNDFADGLARIGSWRLEAERFPLPAEVHMTIRVSE